jgi:hypothetical protein
VQLTKGGKGGARLAVNACNDVAQSQTGRKSCCVWHRNERPSRLDERNEGAGIKAASLSSPHVLKRWRGACPQAATRRKKRHRVVTPSCDVSFDRQANGRCNYSKALLFGHATCASPVQQRASSNGCLRYRASNEALRNLTFL